MYKIKTLNAISDIIYCALDNQNYGVSADEAVPEAVLVRSASMHDVDIPETLLAVARAGAGYNNIPVEAMADRGIVVFNTPGANANAVKELVLCALFAVSRNLVPAADWVRGLKGKGDQVPQLVEKGKNQFVGPEVRGKTIGVIGLGAIGTMVANAARAIGMEAIGYDPFISVASAWGLSRAVRCAQSQAELLACSDYVSIHVPLAKETRGMFNAELIGQMKKGAYLFNFSRAELVDEGAVAEALGSGHLSGYVVDFPTDRMLGVPGALCIPHLGASTPESEENCARMAAEQLRDYLETGTIRNSVNYPDCELGNHVRNRIAILHRNVTNMVGRITTVLANDGINIANMINKSRAEYAYTVIELDTPPSAQVLEDIAAIESVIRVRHIK